MATKKKTQKKSATPKRARRGRAAGMSAATVDSLGATAIDRVRWRGEPLVATLRSGDEPNDTLVMPRVGPKGVGGGLPVRGRANLVEINRLLNDLQKTMQNARSTPSPDGFMSLVIQGWQLLAVIKYVAPPSMEGVIELYRKKLVPITDALYSRCGLRRA